MVDILQLPFVKKKIGYGFPISGNILHFYVGPEEGGNYSENIIRAKLFDQMNNEDGFLDVAKYHLKLGLKNARFFSGRCNIQSTWGKLIAIDHGVRGLDVTNKEVIRDYQVNHFARKGNHMCLLELSPFSSKSLSDSSWTTKEKDLNEISDSRLNLITTKIKKYTPKLCVFYSLSHWDKYKQIIRSME